MPKCDNQISNIFVQVAVKTRAACAVKESETNMEKLITYNVNWSFPGLILAVSQITVFGNFKFFIERSGEKKVRLHKWAKNSPDS